MRELHLTLCYWQREFGGCWDMLEWVALGKILAACWTNQIAQGNQNILGQNDNVFPKHCFPFSSIWWPVCAAYALHTSRIPQFGLCCFEFQMCISMWWFAGIGLRGARNRSIGSIQASSHLVLVWCHPPCWGPFSCSWSYGVPTKCLDIRDCQGLETRRRIFKAVPGMKRRKFQTCTLFLSEPV